MAPKVYVTQETSHDFRKAEEFGEIVFLSVDNRDDFRTLSKSEHNERLLRHLRRGLREFSDDDFLILTGSPYVRAAVLWILGHKKVRKINFLRWDNRDYVYIPFTMQHDN